MQDGQAKFFYLKIICFFLIVSQIAAIAYWQLTYTYNNREYTGTLYHLELGSQILQSLEFTSCVTFDLAHWIFAFSYFDFSYQLELAAKGMPEDTYKCRLTTLNILMCLFSVAVPAFVWILAMKHD
jgi:hypothetical protein